MRPIDKLRLRLRSLFQRSRVEQELDAELRFHLEQLVEENVAAGMSAQDARHAAMRTLGNVALLQEECRDTRRTQVLESIIVDVLFAIRTLKAAPLFTAVALLTLALGIGATTAISTAVNAVILRPLPYPQPDRLVTVWETNSTYNLPGTPAGCVRFSPGNYLDLREQNRAFSQIGAFVIESYNLTGGGNPERVTGGLTSASMFRMLGVQPVLGRVFTESEDTSGADRVVVLGYRLWQDRRRSAALAAVLLPSRDRPAQAGHQRGTGSPGR